jgi:hypothetical protein
LDDIAVNSGVEARDRFSVFFVTPFLDRDHNWGMGAVTFKPQNIGEAYNYNIECPNPKMLSHVRLLPCAISEIFHSTTQTGLLSETDRYGLLAALDESLNEEERQAINRLLRAVRRGQIQVLS